MREIDQQAEREIRELVYDYCASEWEIDRSRPTDETDIIEELEGDSLMLLSLLESVRRKYGLSVELKTLGRHLMNKPANTIGQIVELTLAIVRHGDDIVSLEL